jgi:hypothetical protein
MYVSTFGFVKSYPMFLMRKLIILALISMVLPATAQVEVSWFNYPGGVSVATDALNNVYTANWDYNPGGDITLTKRNESGNILWEVSYDNTDPTRHEVATWVDTDCAGNIVVSGTIRSGYSNPVNANSLLMKFDPSGNLLWRAVYESSFDGSSSKKCITDAQNNIYVLGLGNSGTGIVTTVKKFSPDGTVLWSYFDNAGIGAPINFKFTADNNIIIISRGITGSINGYAKISLNGIKIWSIAGVNSLTVGDAAGDGFGNTYLINGQYGATTTGSVVKKISSSGGLIWEKPNIMAGMRIEVGSDNNPVISGYPNSGTAGAAFMKFDTDGDLLWQNLDADGTGFVLLAHGQMKLDGLNAAYLAASTMSQMAVCKVNSDGTSAWTAATETGYANCLDFGTDNSIFAVGGTTARFTQTPSYITALKPEEVAERIKMYPNPVTKGNFYLELSAETSFPVIMKIYSLTSQLVMLKELNDFTNSIEISGLKTGLYIISVNTKGKVQKLKLQIYK